MFWEKNILFKIKVDPQYQTKHYVKISGCIETNVERVLIASLGNLGMYWPPCGVIGIGMPPSPSLPFLAFQLVSEGRGQVC